MIIDQVYYKEAVAALVVYDVTRPKTFEAVPKWKADLDSKVSLPGGEPIPVVLLANKVQLTHLQYYFLQPPLLSPIYNGLWD